MDNKMIQLVPKYRIEKIVVKWADGSVTELKDPPQEIITTPVRVLELEIARDLRKQFEVWQVKVVPKYL